MESGDAIHRVLESADLVLVVGGMGGSFGSVAAPFVARVARESGRSPSRS